MHVVESLTNAVTAPMNAFFGMAKVKSDYLQTGSSSSSGKHTILQTSVLDGERLVTCAGKTTQPSGEALSDPGVTLAQQVLGLVSDLKLLISGGPGGKPDWNNIRGSVRALDANLRLPKRLIGVPIQNKKSGGLYVEASLERMKDRLDKTKPISSELLPIMEQAVLITKKVNAAARTIESQDDRALNKHKSAVNQMIKNLQGTVTRCNLILQQTGNIATGPGTPKNVSTTSSCAVCSPIPSERCGCDEILCTASCGRNIEIQSAYAMDML